MYEAIPEPPASSWPDQFKVSVVSVVLAGNDATLLVGAAESSVFLTSGVSIGSL